MISVHVGVLPLQLQPQLPTNEVLSWRSSRRVAPWKPQLPQSTTDDQRPRLRSTFLDNRHRTEGSGTTIISPLRDDGDGLQVAKDKNDQQKKKKKPRNIYCSYYIKHWIIYNIRNPRFYLLFKRKEPFHLGDVTSASSSPPGFFAFFRGLVQAFWISGLSRTAVNDQLMINIGLSPPSISRWAILFLDHSLTTETSFLFFYHVAGDYVGHAKLKPKPRQSASGGALGRSRLITDLAEVWCVHWPFS